MRGAVMVQCDACGVALVTLSHPGKKNAIDEAMWRQLATSFAELAQDDAVRAIVITGADGDFAAGGDLSEFPVVRANRARAAAYHEGAVRPALLAIRDCPKPVIAAVEGACVGGGLEIALLCDWIVAAENARFGAPVAKLGFAVYPGEMELIAPRLPRALLARMLLEGALLPTASLVAAGVVTDSVAPGSALTVARAAAERIAARPHRAVAAHKAWLARLTQNPAPLSEEERQQGLLWVDDPEHWALLRRFLGQT
jgi:enoyl-CoA hydratase/carnithine racemase